MQQTESQSATNITLSLYRTWCASKQGPTTHRSDRFSSDPSDKFGYHRPCLKQTTYFCPIIPNPSSKIIVNIRRHTIHERAIAILNKQRIFLSNKMYTVLKFHRSVRNTFNKVCTSGGHGHIRNKLRLSPRGG